MSPVLALQLERFQAFSWMHGLTLLGWTLLIAALVIVGRRLRQRHHETAFAQSLAWVCLALWGVQLWYYLFIVWDPFVSIPLHFCDVAALVGPIAILTRYRPLRNILYFWAFAFTTQGLITPTLHEGPTTAAYWLFWANHMTVIALAVYDVMVRRFRPRFSDVLMAIAITLAYIAILLPINVLNDWNYGFIGPSQPATPTIIDSLGPWPGRIVLILFMGIMMFIHVWLPWPLARWLRKQRNAMRKGEIKISEPGSA
jgi:hypothetical integral membrane protein (TIGR02206 family)